MTDLELAIDQAVAETGHERYRYLCLEHPDPAIRESYSQWILAGRPAQRSVDDVLAEAHAEGILESISPTKPCGGCPG